MTNQSHVSVLTSAHILFFLQRTKLDAALDGMAECYTCTLNLKNCFLFTGHLQSHETEIFLFLRKSVSHMCLSLDLQYLFRVLL
jgi:hypothetical protein